LRPINGLKYFKFGIMTPRTAYIGCPLVCNVLAPLVLLLYFLGLSLQKEFVIRASIFEAISSGFRYGFRDFSGWYFTIEISSCFFLGASMLGILMAVGISMACGLTAKAESSPDESSSQDR
jgi:hypothetical protein